MSLCCTVSYQWFTVMDGITFEFNDTISMNTNNDSERRRPVSLAYFIQYITVTIFKKMWTPIK